MRNTEIKGSFFAVLFLILSLGFSVEAEPQADPVAEPQPDDIIDAPQETNLPDSFEGIKSLWKEATERPAKEDFEPGKVWVGRCYREQDETQTPRLHFLVSGLSNEAKVSDESEERLYPSDWRVYSWFFPKGSRLNRSSPEAVAKQFLDVIEEHSEEVTKKFESAMTSSKRVWDQEDMERGQFAYFQSIYSSGTSSILYQGRPVSTDWDIHSANYVKKHGDLLVAGIGVRVWYEAVADIERLASFYCAYPIHFQYDIAPRAAGEEEPLDEAQTPEDS